MMELADRMVKTPIINMLKNLKGTMIIIKREIKILKRYKWNF